LITPIKPQIQELVPIAVMAINMRLMSDEVRWGTLTSLVKPSVSAPTFAGVYGHFLMFTIACRFYAAAGHAGAQTRCAPGATPGSLACQPDQPQTSTASTIVKIVGHWDKTWGAVADGTNAIGGVSSGALSKRGAEASALKACVDRGGQECAVSFTYFNQCMALLDPGISGGNIVFQTGESIEVARELGLKACKERSGSNSCKATYSSCTYPIYRE
jgi:hypothetical protein